MAATTAAVLENLESGLELLAIRHSQPPTCPPDKYCDVGKDHAVQAGRSQRWRDIPGARQGSVASAVSQFYVECLLFGPGVRRRECPLRVESGPKHFLPMVSDLDSGAAIRCALEMHSSSTDRA